jgi:hypothetical protein
MSGYNDYAVLYDMLSERYDERLQKAEHGRLVDRFLAAQKAEPKARRFAAVIERVGLAFVFFGLNIR